MFYEISTDELSNATNDCLKNIGRGSNACIIKNSKKEPVGAIVSVKQLQMLQRIERNFSNVVTKFRKAGESMTEEEIDDFVNEAVAYARGKNVVNKER